jgi:hypothetical protein
MYGDAYIRNLKLRAAERRAQRAVEATAQITDPRAKLREALTRWQAALPEATRTEAKRQGCVLEDI